MSAVAALDEFTIRAESFPTAGSGVRPPSRGSLERPCPHDVCSRVEARACQPGLIAEENNPAVR